MLFELEREIFVVLTFRTLSLLLFRSRVSDFSPHPPSLLTFLFLLLLRLRLVLVHLALVLVLLIALI